MRAKIRDTEIYFDVEGAGLVPDGPKMREKPIALIIHGGPGADHSSYKPTFSSLRDRLQLIYFDLRGQGRSKRGPKQTYTLENNIEDLEALRQYLGLDKIALIGTSYGGMVALSYASRYPENISRLVVIATTASYHFLERAKAILARKGSPEQIAIAQKLWQGNFQTEAELREYFDVMGSMYSLKYDPNSSREGWQRTIFSIDAINVAFSSCLRSYNVLEKLPKINAPTLVIGGKEDWICPPEFSEAIAKAIPNAKLLMFENCGHLIRSDRPEDLLNSIDSFFK
ncbi:MAG: alpha/beta hydrolase [Prochloraceae cyanobacterium]|nr:alpha/beta hydrolase [Prochloraceae cyanobacterium]